MLKNNGILSQWLITRRNISDKNSHLGPSVPSRKSQAMIPMDRFAKISPHTI